MTKKETSGPLFLGDPEFNKKISTYYAWIPSVVFFLLFGLFIYDHAFVTGFILLVLAIFLLPINKFRVRLHKVCRAIIILGLIFLVFLSMNLYI
jgi:phosphoglycerol transferase MdoB-like AlkP superfamily enzyme